jgi:Domain of unknown function (DUF4349)
MRRIDETPLDPQIAARLDAIDATLAGEPVDPEHAELAELALLLAASRPSVAPEFARSLDQRVARRFAAPAQSAAASGHARPWRPRGSWLGPLAGLSTAAVAAVVAVTVVASAGGGSSSSTSSTARGTATAAVAGSASGGIGTSASAPGGSAGVSASGGSTSTSAASSASSAPGAKSTPLIRTPSSAQSAPQSAQSNGAVFAPATPSASAPQPLPNGRKVIQSAQLALSAASSHIEAVAQELFDVVGRENGYVNDSTVTAGSGGYAQFQLSVPSSALQDTMTALSQLHYATVASRTDATQDVNGRYLNDQRKLTDERTLRTSLLKQLANATTQQQIDSLDARIHDAEASIRSDESTLRGLNHQIDFSGISVTINGAPAPVSHHHSSSGFTLARATHDAGRVLTVAAGVALITLAALAPVALLTALAWWIAVALRRRRREQALDLV